MATKPTRNNRAACDVCGRRRELYRDLATGRAVCEPCLDSIDPAETGDLEVAAVSGRCLCGQFTRNDFRGGTGCNQPAGNSSKFAQGHDAKLKSLAIRAALEGAWLRHTDGKLDHPIAQVARYGSQALANRVRQGVTNATAREAAKAK